MKKSLVCGIMGVMAIVSGANALPSVEAADLCKTYPDKYVYTTSTNGVTKCIPINPCASVQYREMYCVEVPVPVFTGAGKTGMNVFFKKYIQTHYNNASVVGGSHRYIGCQTERHGGDWENYCYFDSEYNTPIRTVVGYKLSDGRYVAFEFTKYENDQNNIWRQNDGEHQGTMCWAWKDCDNWNATKCSKYADFRSLATEDNCKGEMSMSGECLLTCEKAVR